MVSNTERQEGGSHKQILKSSLIIGGASLINILIGLLRMKVVAVLLGPAGIGLIGMLNNLMAAGASVSGMGLANSGTRQIAAANNNNPESLFVARKALFLCTLLLGILGAGLFFALRNSLAEYVFDDPSLSPTIAWLSVGLALAVIAGSQKAVLTGMRRIGDVAKVSVLSSLISALIGVVAISALGSDGILIFVLSVPVVGLLVHGYFIFRLPRFQAFSVRFSVILKQWSVLIRLGSSFMVAGLALLLGQLAVRTIVQHKIGAESLGHFQAAWSISMTYIGFVLAAMGTDYFPRLSQVITDHNAARKMVNEQAEVAILLAGPVLLGMLSFAPWVIRVLYSSEFLEATSVLRWQILGDVIKILCWPMGFIIVASGKGRLFMLKELLITLVFVSGVWLLMPALGLEATGVAFLLMYIVNLPLVMWIAKEFIGFRWSAVVARDALILLTSAVAIAALGHVSELYALAFGGCLVVAISVRSLFRLSEMAELSGPAAKLVNVFSGLLGRVRRDR